VSYYHTMDPYREAVETRIHKAEFVKGIIGSDSILRDGKPQIAFVGRSNVGKSSVINKLLSKPALAKSSSTPGKTSEINFFLVNNKVYVVDLPGYGFAKVGRKIREKFRKRILWYLTESGAKPKYVVLIIDARRGVTDLDEDMIEILLGEDHNWIIVVNKTDKLNQKEHSDLLDRIEIDLLKLGATSAGIFIFSAKTGKGKEKILDYLF